MEENLRRDMSRDGCCGRNPLVEVKDWKKRENRDKKTIGTLELAMSEERMELGQEKDSWTTERSGKVGEWDLVIK